MTESISLRMSLTSPLSELLSRLDEMLETRKKLVVDVTETDMVFVKSVACLHCGRQIPEETPYWRYVPRLLSCSRCEYTCAHSTDNDVPIIKTVTKYSFRSPKALLTYTLEELGFLPETPFRVIDQHGNAHTVTLTA